MKIQIGDKFTIELSAQFLLTTALLTNEILKLISGN